MTAVRIWFQENEILIDTIPSALVAGSLTATLSSAGIVSITRIQSSFSIAAVPWAQVADRTGATFDTPDAVMAYLAGQFTMRRPVGTPTSTYTITASSSFTVDHGLGFAPRATVVDVDGAEIDTDTYHAPGQTTVIFSSPFTGTLYIG